MTQESWDERYRSKPSLWSGEPNEHLIAETGGLVPGRALDVGCGEGGDALWLAERGWDVTGVDISGVALERAVAQAALRNPAMAARLHWVHADAADWSPQPGAFDLVNAQYMHVPVDVREPLFARLATAVAPGGTLLIVGHHPSDLASGVRRPRSPDLYFTADDVARSLPAGDWEITAADVRERSAVHPDGRTVAIHDAVMRARRR